ncbi:transposase [Candidatus Gottesmanbacteria bacterium]|nr:transposase [Candidatus Gottesmanbacteria bacterium]
MPSGIQGIQSTKHYEGKYIILLWDGAPWHRGEVKKHLKDTHKKATLHLLYFPSYSPYLNPQEHIWKLAKQKTVHNSEDSYEDKQYNFRQFIAHTKFNTNFLTKYASS